MRTRWILLLPALVALVALGYLWLRPKSVAPAPAPVEQPVPDAPKPAPTPEAQPLETPEASATTRETEPSEAQPFDQGSIEFPGARIESEIDTKAAPVKLHGTLVDENTKLPLPEFDLEFEVVGEGDGPHRKVSARTDAQGRFACSEPILVARCVVHFLDRPGHKRLPPPWTVDIEDVRRTELALVVPWGATYRLAFAPKEAIDAAGVSVRLRTNAGRGNNTTEWEPVHAADVPWVRFQPLLGGTGKVEKLEARTKDGLWAGEAPASTATGLAPGVTLISFEARAGLDGSVQDSEKHALAEVDVVLEAKDASEQVVKRTARTGADGHFRFDQLPACMGELGVVSVRHTPWSRGVTLLSGQVQQQDVVLEPLAIAGAINVQVESESGSYAPGFTLALTLENDTAAHAGGERYERRVRGQWEDAGGRKVAHFSFPDLPKLGFVLTVQKDDFFTWDPSRLVVQPPSEGTRILIRDGVPNASLAFRVKDASTGEPVPKFELTLEFPGDRMPARRIGARSEQSFLEHFPLERRLVWRLDTAGYAPAAGELAAFQVSERRADGELRVCELELRPGWGECYRFVDSRSRAPLPGIHVLLDGVDAGTSDKAGQVRVHAPTQPGRLEFSSDALTPPLRLLRADRRNGCYCDVRVATNVMPKGKG